jgi:hypothetical protein
MVQSSAAAVLTAMLLVVPGLSLGVWLVPRWGRLDLLAVSVPLSLGMVFRLFRIEGVALGASVGVGVEVLRRSVATKLADRRTSTCVTLPSLALT